MAIIGAMISLTILIVVAAATTLGAAAVVVDHAALQNEQIVSARFDQISLAQRIYEQMSLAPKNSAAQCMTSLTDLLKATGPMSPVDDTAELIAADRATLGVAARPYHGYFFKLTTWADAPADDPSPHWVIFAWPAHYLTSTRAELILEPGSSPRRLTNLRGEPPSDPTHDQIFPGQ